MWGLRQNPAPLRAEREVGRGWVLGDIAGTSGVSSPELGSNFHYISHVKFAFLLFVTQKRLTHAQYTVLALFIWRKCFSMTWSEGGEGI